MESGDQQIPENPAGDQQVTSQVAAAKSYECTFCKRGFSNAQALGGHMNSHRKDKAKLKKVSSSSNIAETKQQQQQRLPLEIPKISHSYSPILPKINYPSISTSLEAISMPHADHTEKFATATRGSWPAEWFLIDEEAGDNKLSDLVQVQHLPMFSQASSDQDHQNQGRQQQPEDHGDQSEKDSDMDLELRLGPEPHDSSSTSTKATTRKFF